MNLNIFNNIKFISALKMLFKELNVPINYVTDEPTSAKEILKDTYKDNDTFRLIESVYFVGMVDDAAFEGSKSLAIEKIKSDYDGILIFGVTLKERSNGLLPTRSQLAEISRSFNREFYYTPVTIVFKYSHYMAFANTERMKYRQEWREGEKAGKVILLRDIDIEKPHSGHERILSELRIPTSGKESVTNFEQLYTYWHKVFNVSLLNKKFYEELSNWYFWATKQVTFPGAPTNTEAYQKKAKLDDLLQEHRATNVIRMLTRLLFVWFIKEKKLIPEELFELETLQKDILKEISPYHEKGMFKETNKDSVYYKAILQNLFFATLNCPIEGDNLDKRKRGFRGEGYGTHRGIDYLMRYKQYFKNPETFLKKVNAVVPFLNGGLFECLDEKYNNIYIDGFSDQMTQGEVLIVPDYLFFGVEEKVDLSNEYGVSNKGTKEAAVKGLINILKSYKFTITENTPIEEEVALDPELLGKVFENLLASYNPETKTTARKQTGSFYTPREIVSYMVDESLISYLKNSITNCELDSKEFEKELYVLTAYDSKVPFDDNKPLQKQIVEALSKCTILDPACGSGAFPMGVLHKMVHILQKLDPDNKIWKQVNLLKAEEDSRAAFEIEDKLAREERLLEINEAFDQNINDPDYARKLFLIENCIYGVDIQPIATQISKLRFFISLVVEQKVNPLKENFGIRPLPNLETKFVTANTLLDIEKPKVGENLNIFSGGKVDDLENELKSIRSRLFSARTKETKLKYRKKDLELRSAIADELKLNGWTDSAADKLAKWDPYNQNMSSSFFNSEWMFDIKTGFDIVIGNPPYIKENTDKSVFDGLRKSNYYQGKMDLWYFFASICIDMLKSTPKGCLCFIATNNWTTNAGASNLRNKILKDTQITKFIDFADFKIFESAGIQTMVFVLEKNRNILSHKIQYSHLNDSNIKFSDLQRFLRKEADPCFKYLDVFIESAEYIDNTLNFSSHEYAEILDLLEQKRNFRLLSSEINSGIDIPQDSVNGASLSILGSKYSIGQGIFVLSNDELDNLELSLDELKLIKPFYTTSELFRYNVNPHNEYVIIYTDSSFKNPKSMSKYPKLKRHLDEFQKVITSENRPYGLNRARDERFFIGERIIVQRKCPAKPSFVYVDFDSYFNRTFIPIKTNRISLKFLTGILNSKISAFWLKHKGKMQGDNFQVDKDPILSIPIYTDSKNNIVEQIVSFALISNDKLFFEEIIDAVVFNIYFPDHMRERNIDILEFVEKDLGSVLEDRKFEKLDINEKVQVISNLQIKWSHPDNEIRNRIKLFAVRSPDILKPIIES